MKTFLITETKFGKETLKQFLKDETELYSLIIFNDCYKFNPIDDIYNSGYNNIEKLTFTTDRNVVIDLLNRSEEIIFDISDHFLGSGFLSFINDKSKVLHVMYQSKDIKDRL